jgi:hypothetical protein
MSLWLSLLPVSQNLETGRIGATRSHLITVMFVSSVIQAWSQLKHAIEALRLEFGHKNTVMKSLHP